METQAITIKKMVLESFTLQAIFHSALKLCFLVTTKLAKDRFTYRNEPASSKKRVRATCKYVRRGIVYCEEHIVGTIVLRLDRERKENQYSNEIRLVNDSKALKQIGINVLNFRTLKAWDLLVILPPSLYLHKRFYYLYHRILNGKRGSNFF